MYAFEVMYHGQRSCEVKLGGKCTRGVLSGKVGTQIGCLFALSCLPMAPFFYFKIVSMF